MPRRHTPSAAGVLAAIVLAAAVPADAQDTPGLRGSLGTAATDDSASASTGGGTPGLGTLPSLRTSPGSGTDAAASGSAPASAPRRRRSLELRGGIVDDAAEAGTANDLATEPALGEPLGGIGDETEEEAAAQDSGGVVARELRPSTVDPRLRDSVVDETAVPGFGIDEGRAEEPGTVDAFGEPVETPLRDDILEVDPVDDVLGLRARRLDPFEPLGTRLGSFLLFTEAEVGGIFTDNVLGTPVGRSDYAFEFAPQVRLESDWSRHAFQAEFTADRSWFNKYSVEDDKTYAALLRGRLDVGARTNLELELGKAQTQDGRNATSITDVAGFQTNVQEEQISAKARHTFNRLTLELEGSVSTFDYEDLQGRPLTAAEILGGDTLLAQDVRDYREDELTLRGTYEFNPDLAVYMEGELSQDVYKQPVSVTGLTRDSTGYATLAGMTFALNDVVFGDISLGWGEQSSIDEGTAPIEGVLLNADVVWMPTPMTMVEFIASSTIAPASLVDSLGAVSRTYQLSLQQAFWRFFVVGGYLSYETADYTDNPLADERLREGLTMEYFFNPNMSLYTRYEHTDFMSTDRFNEYAENEVRVGMRIRN